MAELLHQVQKRTYSLGQLGVFRSSTFLQIKLFVRSDNPFFYKSNFLSDQIILFFYRSNFLSDQIIHLLLQIKLFIRSDHPIFQRSNFLSDQTANISLSKFIFSLNRGDLMRCIWYFTYRQTDFLICVQYIDEYKTGWPVSMNEEKPLFLSRING